MSAPNHVSAPFRSGFDWPLRFSEKGEVARDFENRPWLSYQEQFESPRDIISFFLGFDDDDVRYHGRVRPILDICQNMDLYDLSIDNESPDANKKVAWLIDGQLVDDEINFRDSLGSLSARQLTEALSKPRYLNLQALPAHSTEEEYTQEMLDFERIPAVDAERRLLYLTNLDCWSILALVKTAPLSQAKLLGHFFHKHLCSRTSIGVSFVPSGPQTFSLEFHLPFRVWRRTKQLLKDNRIKKSDNEALRSSRDVTYLMPSGDENEGNQVHGIYSGHIACAVSGYDYWRWTAYFAIDTWFDETEGINDQVTRYDSDKEEGIEWDPCSGGQDDAKRPFWYPRIWFLRIFGIRLDQIKDEWESICLHLGQNLDRKDRKYKVLLEEARSSPEIATEEQHRLQVNALERSVLESRDVLQDLLSVVQETVKVGASFLSTEVNFFLNFDGKPGDASECYPYLSEIRRMFNVLDQLRIRLESYQERYIFLVQYCQTSIKNTSYNSSINLDQRFATSSRDLYEIKVEVETLRNEWIQMRFKNDQLLAIGPGDVEEVRVLAFSTLLTQAFSQTTALFSADNVIAFTRNWKTFLVSLLVAYGINVTIGTAFLIWIRRARHRLKTAVEKKPNMLPVVQPIASLTSTSAVTQNHATHTSPTRYNEGDVAVYTRRRFSDRLWLGYRRSQRMDDIELGNRNVE